MSTFIKKAFSKSTEQIGRFYVDEEVFSIVAKGNLALGLLNGYSVVDTNLYEDPISGIVPVMSSLVSKTFRDKWYDGLKVVFYKEDWDSKGKYPSDKYKESLEDQLSILLGEGNLETRTGKLEGSVLEEKKNEVSPDKLAANISVLSERFKGIVAMSEHLLEKIYDVGRVKLVPTMWGVDGIISDLEGVRDKKDYIDELYNNLNVNIKLGVKACARMSYRINRGNNLTTEDKKYVSMILIPDIKESYVSVKQIISKLLTAVGPLYNMEENFQISTGNQASWSFPGAVLTEIKNSFDFLLSFLMESRAIEQGVVEPLELLQDSFTVVDKWS